MFIEYFVEKNKMLLSKYFNFYLNIRKNKKKQKLNVQCFKK